MVVEVTDLRRTYGTFEALAGISLSVPAGGIVGLLGPNGAGKTTTLRILTGALAPTSGSVRVCGHDVLLDPIAVRRAVGYLPESAPVDSEVTVRAYLDFVGRVRGLGASERARAIDRVAASCHLADRLSQRVGTLSRGYRQRVGLAQALLHEPALLVLDEPTNGLDPNQVAEMRALIRELGRTRTVVLSTHVLSEVEAVCDRVVILHRGRVVADGATSGVVARAAGHAVVLGIGAGKVRAHPDALAAELSALPGVGHVEAVAPVDEAHRFVLHADTDVREAVFRWAVAGGHVVLELSRRRADLEDVFRQLTTRRSA